MSGSHKGGTHIRCPARGVRRLRRLSTERQRRRVRVPRPSETGVAVVLLSRRRVTSRVDRGPGNFAPVSERSTPRWLGRAAGRGDDVTVIVDPRTLLTTDVDALVQDRDPDQIADDPYLRCLDACVSAARESSARVEFCLQNSCLSDLAGCVDAATRCADICQAVGWAVTRRADQPTGWLRHLLVACALACERCLDGCSPHPRGRRHLRAWERACRRCEEACHDLLAALPPISP